MESVRKLELVHDVDAPERRVPRSSARVRPAHRYNKRSVSRVSPAQLIEALDEEELDILEPEWAIDANAPKRRKNAYWAELVDLDEEREKAQSDDSQARVESREVIRHEPLRRETTQISMAPLARSKARRAPDESPFISFAEDRRRDFWRVFAVASAVASVAWVLT